VVKLESVTNLFGISETGTAFNQETDALVGPSDRLGDLVDILGLDHGLEVILEKLGEVVCNRCQLIFEASLGAFWGLVPYSAARNHGSA
jgi:hypothetical protein